MSIKLASSTTATGFPDILYVPTGLMLVVGSEISDGFGLSWTEPQQGTATGYTLYDDFDDSVVDGTDVTPIAWGQTSYTLTGLSVNTTKTYYLKTTDGSNFSTASNTATGTTANAPNTTLYIPTNFAVTPDTVTQNSCQVTWTSPTQGGATDIRLYGNSTLLATIPFGATSYGVSGLTSDTFYTFYIVTTDGSLESSPSNTDTATTAVVTAGLLFSDDFESGNFNAPTSTDGGGWDGGVHATVTTPPTSGHGNYCLRLQYKSDTDPTNNNAPDAWAQKDIRLGARYPDLWVKFEMYIPSNYVERSANPSNNKGPVWMFTDHYDQPRDGPKLGTSWWNTNQIIMFAGARINGSSNANTHYNRTSDVGGAYSPSILSSDKGTWVTWVVHYKYATIANNDGIAQVWKIDSNQTTIPQINMQDGPWYATLANSTTPADGFDVIRLMGWFNTGFVAETNFYIDNLSVSTEPLI